MSRTAPFMFLGGPLDHATRHLPISGAFCVPTTAYVHTESVKPYQKMFGSPSPEMPTTVYSRHRIASADRSWFAFIAAGHEPTTAELLDTYPYPPIT